MLNNDFIVLRVWMMSKASILKITESGHRDKSSYGGSCVSKASGQL